MSNQQELPGMPEETPLGEAAKRFVAVKEEMAAAKLQIADIEKEIMQHMKADNVPHFKISVGGENYEFELVNSEESVRCAKITKTVKKTEPAKKPASEPVTA